MTLPCLLKKITKAEMLIRNKALNAELLVSGNNFYCGAPFFPAAYKLTVADVLSNKWEIYQ